jgi:TonB-dependent starch-binding outer membrane protein SusC
MKNKPKPDILFIKSVKKIFLIMKISLLLILVSAISLHAGNIFSQNNKMTVDMRDVTVREVIREIEKQGGISFLFNDNLQQLNRHVSVSHVDQPLHAVLFSALEQADMMYEEVGENFLVLLPKPEYLKQQGITVTGRVTDAETGETLPGVSVTLKGITFGTTTNPDGVFVLNNVPEDAIIVFSFVGMVTLEIPVEGRNIINAELYSDVIGIDEVVAIGYGTMRRSDVSGSVVRADVDAFRESPNASIMQSLQGSVPGLSVGQVNQAGQEPSILLRGLSSISGALTPLIVVDNVIFRGNLIDINPADIESINILKDASSAAIYGSQAANGVILIATTKHGEVDKPTINFTSSYSFQSPAKRMKMEDPEEFIKRTTEIDLLNSRTPESGYLEPVEGYEVTSTFRTGDQIDAYNAGNFTDWFSLLTNDNMYTQNHNLSLTNRTDNSSYYISVGFLDQQGYMVNEGYNRWNVRINADNTVTDWLSVGVQSFMTSSDYSGEALLPGGYWTHPYGLAYEDDGSYVVSPGGVGLNPLFSLETDDFNKRMNLFGNIYADIDIPFIEGLSFRTNYSSNLRTTKHYFFRPHESDFQGRGRKAIGNGIDWSNDNILSYKNSFGDHRVDLTLVYGVEKRSYESTTSESSVFVSQVLGYNRLQAGSADLQSATTNAWEETSLYNMARLFYGYDNRYLITGTIRRDGFSGFSEGNKFGLFPSISVAWVASEEEFLREQFNWLDLFKIRASYGSIGNRTIGRYGTLAGVGGGYNYVSIDGSPIYTQAISSLASPGLKWETTTGINLGIDFGFAQVIHGSIDYYNNNTTNLLYDVDIPGIGRFLKFPDNLGRLHNTGLEIELFSRNLTRQDFRWTSTFNFSRNRNSLKELLGFDLTGDGKEDDLIAEKLFIGHPLNVIYDFEITGELWQVGDDIPPTADMGTYKIVDQNEDGIINLDDRTILGTTDPLFQFSVGNRVTYKNWTFAFFINSIVGNSEYYLGADDLWGLHSPGQLMQFTQSQPSGLDYWMPENPDSRYQRITVVMPSDLTATSYIPRSFVRLQDLTLSYDITRVLDVSNIQGLVVHFNGKNLFTWTKWPGWDPETGQKILRGGRPVLRSYSFGIDVRF